MKTEFPVDFIGLDEVAAYLGSSSLAVMETRYQRANE